jgi:2-polyprenyl-3-methyl-5-hydroxy-6-metoxy-1,4-benzoquinol methylase
MSLHPEALPPVPQATAATVQVAKAIIGYFNQVSPGWADTYRANGHFHARLRTVLNWIGQGAGSLAAMHILDFGCGSGVLVEALLTQGQGRGYTVTGVDGSPGMINAARNRLGTQAGYMLSVIDPVTWEGPYAGLVYDGICCLGVLEYVDNDQALLRHLAGLLRPGGFLILSLPNRSSLLRGLEGLIHANPGLFRPFGLFRHLTAPDSYLNFQKHQYNLSELALFLQKYGLRQERSWHHVAPRGLCSLEHLPLIGMITLALFRKSSLVQPHDKALH